MHVNLHIIHPEYHMKLRLMLHTNCALMKFAEKITSRIDLIRHVSFPLSIRDDPVFSICKKITNQDKINKIKLL